VPGALQADKLGHVLEVLAENVLVASRKHRHGAHAEFEQLLSCRRVVHYVKRDEVNAFFRKKLFRPQATASTRLGEQDQFVSDALHDRVQHCSSPRYANQRGLTSTIPSSRSRRKTRRLKLPRCS